MHRLNSKCIHFILPQYSTYRRSTSLQHISSGPRTTLTFSNTSSSKSALPTARFAPQSDLRVTTCPVFRRPDEVLKIFFDREYSLDSVALHKVAVHDWRYHLLFDKHNACHFNIWKTLILSTSNCSSTKAQTTWITSIWHKTQLSEIKYVLILSVIINICTHFSYHLCFSVFC